MSEWDHAKRLYNLDKHGLDFTRADELFDGRPVANDAGHSETEERFRTVALLDGRFVTLVWTWRGESRRYISLRSARNEEKRQYLRLHGEG